MVILSSIELFTDTLNVNKNAFYRNLLFFIIPFHFLITPSSSGHSYQNSQWAACSIRHVISTTWYSRQMNDSPSVGVASCHPYITKHVNHRGTVNANQTLHAWWGWQMPFLCTVAISEVKPRLPLMWWFQAAQLILEWTVQMAVPLKRWRWVICTNTLGELYLHMLTIYTEL